MKNKKPSQSEVILNMLRNDELVTPSTVFKKTKKLCGVGSMKLSTRIGELVKTHKLKIKKMMVYTGKSQYMMYELK